MAEKKPKKTSTTPRARPATAKGLSAEERAAIKERAAEMKAEARGRAGRQEGERALLEKIAAMRGTDRSMAERIHAIVTANAPALSPKTWYGMPAYAKDGKVVCFFQSAEKFTSRYATFGFTDAALLDAGAMWPTAFALKEITPAVEKQITALIKKSVR